MNFNAYVFLELLLFILMCNECQWCMRVCAFCSYYSNNERKNFRILPFLFCFRFSFSPFTTNKLIIFLLVLCPSTAYICVFYRFEKNGIIFTIFYSQFSKYFKFISNARTNFKTPLKFFSHRFVHFPVVIAIQFSLILCFLWINFFDELLLV